jgi:putative SOS response-associated peptidase YedK
MERSHGAEVDSCTIITTIPNSHLADIHDRMPVILPSGAYLSWLNPSMRDPHVAWDGSCRMPVR